MKTIGLLLFVLYSGQWARADIYCRDENNNPIDWYVFYKLPKLKSSSVPSLKAGNGYMFITSASLEKGWQFSTNTIDDKSSLLRQTLPFLKNPQQQVLWFVYNDQGDAICPSCGHTKGVIAGDKSGGIWLIHSIPKLLDGNYPRSGLKFGQSALCISLSREQLDSVGDLLAYNTPNFQRSNIINDLKSLYPKIMAAYQKVKVKEPWSLEKTISTLNGTNLKAFAKARRFSSDLYEWVAKSLETTLYVETWINDAHPLPSNCSIKFRVINVQSVIIPQLNVQFSSHSDHSKIAISDSGSKPWVCVGDINRTLSQERRGGGTVCLNNTKLWNSYQSLINLPLMSLNHAKKSRTEDSSHLHPRRKNRNG
uniref:Deoxyribonuclease ii n=1 Tax=Riptortus pedestris TaxID=329032 RepID=R4WDE9_RIPPE|nr:deoxyribonuclease ii [Riptortus pedestris]